MGYYHLCHTRSYLTEQFTKSQSVPSISRVMKTTIPTEVVRCSPFILSCSHTGTSLTVSLHLRLKEESSVPCFVPFHSIFFLCHLKMDPSQVRKTSFTPIHRKKPSFLKTLHFTFTSTSILPAVHGHINPPTPGRSHR